MFAARVPSLRSCRGGRIASVALRSLLAWKATDSGQERRKRFDVACRRRVRLLDWNERHWPLLRQTGGNSQLHRGWGCCDIQQHCEHCRAGPVWYLACDESRSVTTVEHQGGRRFFWEGPKFFELCPIVLNYVHYNFSRGGGAKSFSGGASPILRPLVMGVDKSWIAFRFRTRSTKIFRVQ